MKHLYSAELDELESKNARVQEIDAELLELVENAKSEDTDENIALYQSIKKNDDDEPQDTFESKTVKAELKKTSKGTIEYDLLKKVEKLMSEKSKLNKEIKAEDKVLQELIYERITNLTDAEIDHLVFEKWFGSTVNAIVNLVTIPLKAELSTLEKLVKRYANTFSEIDTENRNLEKQFESLLSELVVE